ncbi:type IVB secretion system protein IcmN/DotK [Legionella micdadei]|uniref:Component of the Dot/Icm secretion system. Lipoprotein of the OmpA protein family n=1 Tax=Legionella micdadei TaxID=451 RepID=A0A098GIH8_LEGMI|nr:protein LphA [Legionella micdadei]ARG99554.1 protein LphA [Legionella micdadei]KTD26497.1 LphA (DotK) [Legionella micdadei]CEG61785.1 Component of the Dot/Icm secretion system. Lipoprotein of the OmpA protein family [Legionella micdadei]SCY23428.1 intracellular multiplication protein IcmN [Legionella micdadei]
MRRLRVGLLAFSTWHATLLAFLLLLGCKTKVYHPEDNEALKLPYKVEGADDEAIIGLQKSLKRCGVAVITIGQDYLISIPSASLFPNQSPQLTWASYGLLNNVVRFLKQFRKVAVNITAFSGKYVSQRREHALTLARARAVADYLWSQGIDSRFIFTEGMGSDKPMMGYTRGGDKSPNSRIEITFRDAIV